VSYSATPRRLAEVVGRDQIGLERHGEGIDDELHVLVLERLQHVAEGAGAEVELFVEGVDRGFGVDLLAAPVALRATAPETPVPAVSSLLPANRLYQSRAASRTDVQGDGGLGSAGARVSHVCTIEPAKRLLHPHFRVKTRESTITG